MSFPVFNYMGNKFEARVRDYRTITRTTRMKEGDVTIANQIAVLEVKFDFDILDRLHEPSFVGIERKTAEGSTTYLIYEITAPTPIHFQMLGMDVSMPSILRKEYLNTIDASWGSSDEAWIDVVSVPTQYRMDIDGDEPRFSRSKLTPLIGSKAYLLSDDTVRKFLCVEGGIPIGTLIGFDIPLTVSIDNIVRYHTGVFGFTGTGKSNLTSYLIREAAKSMHDLRIVIFDVSGEYSIHLLDLLMLDGMVYSTEDLSDPEDFINSQTIPETLEEMLSEDTLLEKVQGLISQGRVRRITAVPQEAHYISIGFIISILQKAMESKGSGSVPANIAIQELYRYLTDTGYDVNTDTRVIRMEDRERLIIILKDALKNIHNMSALYKDLERLIDYLGRDEKHVGKERDTVSMQMDPRRLAFLLLNQEAPKVNIIYIPEPDEARDIVSRFIDSLFFFKKRARTRRKVLIVLDEAQEFIPNRSNKDDASDRSNRSVEALLRQGRKYRLHCWLSSQRIAHLNVNALQQLHSYFVSTLPRFYDRMVIADAFSLSYDILEKTTDLETGQWLFVSYKATRQKNVPVFIRTPNNEEILLREL